MTTTTADLGKTETKAKPSPSASRTKKRKPASKAAKAKAAEAKAAVKRTVSLENARREVHRLICASSADITQALIKNALQGSQLQAKFLFEVAGLTDTKGDEVDDATQRETLASFLLTRWQVETQTGQGQNGSAHNGQVTEVAEVTPDLAVETKAPVEL